MPDVRRGTILFSQDQAADSLYFLEEGLVKLTRTNEIGDRIILCMQGPGDLVGEESLAADAAYSAEAEVLTPGTVFRVPRDILQNALVSHPEATIPFMTYLSQRKLALTRKVELLCLHDVEYRVLHFLADLSSLVRPMADGHGFQIPITQLELADLVGATRETTSTTLNQLERRGLLKLSRRMLTVSSPDVLRQAAKNKNTTDSSLAKLPAEPSLDQLTQ